MQTTPTTSVSPGPVELGCAAGSTSLHVPQKAGVNGLVSEFIAGLAGADLSGPVTVSAGGQRYVALKSVLYATPAAAPKTTVTLTSPPSARLYYTDWGTWSNGVSDAHVLRVADTAVTVGSCGDQTVGYPGFLLVTGPGCVTMRISGSQSFSSKVRTVPVSRKSC